ncbi:MAG TPA: D-cysteine desulfhydrase family protein [Vicinamibacterales bacterium]|nr:D-cysteine desulfhydrase family protein [Vicinamibacterales bacterium]
MFGSLAVLPAVPLAPTATPVEEMTRLRAALGRGPRLLVKRDDAIGFAFGGNKVRKIRLVAADALAQGADTLITTGGVQSNHARVTAAAAAKLGLHCILVVNGSPPDSPSANALLDRLLGAEMRYVPSREDRAPAMEAAAAALRRVGRRPYLIPLGASTPLGAAAFVQAVDELLQQIEPPDVILHASSSGGTQAGLVAGCSLAGVDTRVLGISADEPAGSLEEDIRGILSGLGPLLGFPSRQFEAVRIEVDDRFVGEGYGVPTAESRAAIELAARTEALFLDPTYTAKAMAGLIAHVRAGSFGPDDTVLFWHTGGQVGLFA